MLCKIYIYIYIYISMRESIFEGKSFTHTYIDIHTQSLSLYHNLSVWLDTPDALSWNLSPANFTSAW